MKPCFEIHTTKWVHTATSRGKYNSHFIRFGGRGLLYVSGNPILYSDELARQEPFKREMEKESGHPAPTAIPDSNPIRSHSCRSIPHQTQLSALQMRLTVRPLGWLAPTRRRPRWIAHTRSALGQMTTDETYQPALLILSISPREERTTRGRLKTLKTTGSRVSEPW